MMIVGTANQASFIIFESDQDEYQKGGLDVFDLPQWVFEHVYQLRKFCTHRKTLRCMI
jgi:hypothetical protein